MAESSRTRDVRPSEVENWEVTTNDPRHRYIITIQQPDGGFVTVKGLITFGHRRFINPARSGKDYWEVCLIIRGERADGSTHVEHLSIADFGQRVSIESGWKPKSK